MFEIENDFTYSYNSNTWGENDLISNDIISLDFASFSAYTSQDRLILGSEFESEYIEETAIALQNKSDSYDSSNLDLLSDNASTDPGNSLSDAQDILLNKTPSTYRDWVGESDSIDYYRFSLDESSDFELSLSELEENANVQLLDSEGTQLMASRNYGTDDESIVAQLLPGTYYIGVYSIYSWENTDYNLTVAAASIDEPGNSLNDAQDIFLNETPSTYRDWVGETDSIDYYRFSLDESSDFELSLSELEENANVQLLDSEGTQLMASRNYGTDDETIITQLLPGTYYIGVYSIYSWENTDYTLTVSTSPVTAVPGYDTIEGFGLVDAASAVAEVLGQAPFDNLPDLGGNNWGADLINAPEVWTQGYTGEDILVVVLDTGVDYNHPDLSNNIFTNEGEIAGDGIDNDHNGYIDDFYGWNFDSDNNNTLDVRGHGTHVAGTIAAQNNDFGVTGIAYDAQIMPVKVLGDSGNGEEESLAEGIRYAVDNGARVINMSLGGDIDNSSMRSAVEYAASRDVIVVMAAGNDRYSTTMGSFPAAYATDWGIAVGAVDRDEEMASFSNRSGEFPLTYVTAPGVDVYSTVPNNSYDDRSGTSMATPHVAGVVALMLSADPTLTESQVLQILTDTTV